MAARETGFGAVEQYMHAGKLLALELLVRAFENPHHHWTALRPEVRAWLGICTHTHTSSQCAARSRTRTTTGPHCGPRSVPC